MRSVVEEQADLSERWMIVALPVTVSYCHPMAAGISVVRLMAAGLGGRNPFA